MRRKIEDMLWAIKIGWYKRKQARQEQREARAQFEIDGELALTRENAIARMQNSVLGPDGYLVPAPNEYAGVLKPKMNWPQLWEDARPALILSSYITGGGIAFIGLLAALSWITSKF